MTEPLDRYMGSLLGLACGDAVGTAVEFSPRGSFTPLTDMIGGGPFGLAPGQWTDDTSMALCLAESLIHKKGFDARDQMERYLKWRDEGYLSSTGKLFDIGRTVEAALERFRTTGEPFAGSTNPDTAGNGALMRLAPVVLFHHPNLDLTLRYAEESSRTTHGAPEAVECCRLLALLISRALGGAARAELIDASGLEWSEPRVRDIARGTYQTKSRDEVAGTGYCVASLEAALWCFHSTTTFEEAVLAAANLGDDADTTAAITGQLAGAFYGILGIPRHWAFRVHQLDFIQAVGFGLYAHGHSGWAARRATLDP